VHASRRTRLSLRGVEEVTDPGIEVGEQVVPHLDHRVRQRGDDQLDAVVVEVVERARVLDDAMLGFHVL